MSVTKGMTNDKDAQVAASRHVCSCTYLIARFNGLPRTQCHTNKIRYTHRLHDSADALGLFDMPEPRTLPSKVDEALHLLQDLNFFVLLANLAAPQEHQGQSCTHAFPYEADHVLEICLLHHLHRTILSC